MHDLARYDRLGLPACAVATVEFEVAAARQAEALGFEPAVHFVAHPIQNRTPEELKSLAEGAVQTVLDAIGNASPPPGSR